MRGSRVHYLLLVMFIAVAGCGPLQVEASFKTPAELTATALDRVTVTQQLGKIAYVQMGDIWIRDLPDGKPRRLTQVGQDTEPRWSPSGQWLAFRENSHLWIERADGTDAHVVEGGAAIDRYVWSPVEDRLAYAQHGGLSVETADGGRRWILMAASRQAEHGVRDIAWSFDGRQLAFDQADRRLQGIWRVNAEGGRPQVVYREPHAAQLQSYLAGWSPDGKYLLFWRGGLSSSSQGAPLMAMPSSGGKPRQIGPMLLHRDLLSWAPDGKRLTLIAGAGEPTWENKALAVATVHGGMRRLSVDHAASGQYAYLYPIWSPDGRWIAVTRGPAVKQTAGGDVAGLAVEKRRIWLVSADGASARALTASSAFRDERPLWSADGSSILFVRLNGKFAELWLMQADGSHQQVVASSLFPASYLGWWGDYGYVDWGQLYDWWTGRVGQPAS